MTCVAKNEATATESQSGGDCVRKVDGVMLLSIIVINYNTFELTCNCIRSIQQTADVEHEIILVDNNSKECDAAAFLKTFPGIKLISLKENVGFGRANNLGVEKANGKYVLLLNSDTIVKPRTINETVGYLEKNSSVDILGCKVVFEDDKTVQTTVVKDEREYSLLSAIKYLIKRNTLFVETRLIIHNRRQRKSALITSKKGAEGAAMPILPDECEPIEMNFHNGKRIGSLVGVFILLKRSVYLESKGFDPDFFMYYEEIEWFVNRLRKYNIVYYPHATVLHFHGGSDVHKKMNLQFWVSQHLFWYKMGYAQYFLYLLFNLADIPSRWLVRVMYDRKRPSQDVPAMLKALGCFTTVLRYPNRYGGRRQMLKLAYLQKNNL